MAAAGFGGLGLDQDRVTETKAPGSASRLEHQLLSGTKPLPLALGIVLYWIAGADGAISDDEWDALTKRFTDLGISGFFAGVERKPTPPSHPEIDFACRTIWGIQDQRTRVGFLLEAVVLALSDRRLTATENHILRLITDLLRLLPSDLETAFLELTGTELPEPGDVSSREWWETRESTSRARRPRAPHGGSDTGSADTPLHPEVTRAFYILGLEPGAGRDEIKAAYRRMSQVHHPDRFASLGPEAVQAATHSFQRITDAYNLLLAR